MFRSTLLIFLLAFVVLIGFSYLIMQYDQEAPEQPENVQESDKRIIYLNSKGLRVDIADEPQEQSQGLSGLEFMVEDEGMLFIFEQPVTPSFWTKGMNFALDIIWIDESAKVIGIQKNISPDTYPNTFTPPFPVKYVIEVNAGWSDRNGIKVGDQLEF